MTQSQQSQPLLEARGATAAYGRRPVLQSVDISVRPGEFVGLAGPNGSGKTTLLHCLTGYQQLQAGTVMLGGSPVHATSRAEVARLAAFVPQFTESVYGFGVLEMVLMGRFPYSGHRMLSSTEDMVMADAALATMQVQHLRDRSFNELSGGEKQLVLLARAIVQDAPLLIMDEPLTGLDLRHQFQVMQAMRNLSKKPGGAVLATFHDLPVAARWCDRIVLLKDGQVMADGSPNQVITSDLIRKVYDVSARVAFDEQGELQLSVTGTDES